MLIRISSRLVSVLACNLDRSPLPALLLANPSRHQFREGLCRLYPAEDDLENGGDGDGQKHPGDTPDQTPEHEEEEDGDRVQVHAFPHQFGFNDVSDCELYGPRDGQDDPELPAETELQEHNRHRDQRGGYGADRGDEIEEDRQDPEEKGHLHLKREEEDKDQYPGDEGGQELGGHVAGYVASHMRDQAVVVIR